MELHRAIDPSQLGGAELYDILCSKVVPRPIALVSSIASSGEVNLAPFSFFMLGGTNPPSLSFSVTLSMNGQEKQTLRNIRETADFTVHQVVREMGVAMEATADGASDWVAMGLTLVPGESVKCPRILESPTAFECELKQIVEHGSGPGSARYVIGTIRRIFIGQSDGSVIARLGGKHYLDLANGEILEISGSNATPKPS